MNNIHLYGLDSLETAEPWTRWQMQRIDGPKSDWKECSGHPRWGSSTFRYRRAPYLPEPSELPIIDSEVAALRMERLELRLAIYQMIAGLACGDKSTDELMAIAREVVA